MNLPLKTPCMSCMSLYDDFQAKGRDLYRLQTSNTSNNI